MLELANTITKLYQDVQANPEHKFDLHEINTIQEAVGELDNGKIRVAEKIGDNWKVNEWVKKSILLYFRTQPNVPSKSGELSYFDKVPTKQWNSDSRVRVVPPAVVRYGSFVEAGCIIMPGYVNIGAYVGAGSMVDTWATVGSCAQIGKNVHLSGGVGIGGVLEPAQAQPVIIEDHAFIGSRCIIVEGVRVGEGAVLGAGVVLTSSTKIVDVRGPKEVITKGSVPKNAVVIPGTIPKKFPAGEYGTPCALIIGERSAQTDQKTSLNHVLREFEVSV